MDGLQMTAALTDTSQSDADGLVAIAGLLMLAFAYMLPTIIASVRRHNHTAAIGAANLVFGWTIVGWFVAFIWALTNDTLARCQPVERCKRPGS